MDESFTKLIEQIDYLKANDFSDERALFHTKYVIDEESLEAIKLYPDLDRRGPKMCEYLDSVRDADVNEVCYGINVNRATTKTIMALLNVLYLDARWGGDIDVYFKNGYVLKLLERLKENEEEQ